RQQTPPQEVNIEIKYLDANTISYNGYSISNCGNVHDKPPEIHALLAFLHRMKPQLERVIKDSQQGTRSLHGYSAFFKSDRNIRKVAAAYQQMVDASPIIVSAERAKVIGKRTPQPLFRCLKEGDPNTTKIMDGCKSGAQYGFAGNNPILITPGTELIYVCPVFFELTQFPPPKRACPTLGSDGQFKPGEMSLLTFGFSYIVYALALMYDRGMYDLLDNRQELRDMQYAVELNSRVSMLNAASYGFYAGGLNSPQPCLWW
ncbi:MAG: hypothetical protein Q9224_003959, partial [Gallowayella concinna]